MDKTALVEPKKKDGERLLAALDEAAVPIRSAFWYYVPEQGIWRLVLASPLVSSDGPNKIYSRIQSALRALGSTEISLSDIWLVKDSEPLVRLIRSTISTAPTA